MQNTVRASRDVVSLFERVADRNVRDLFDRFRADPGLMPLDWAAGCGTLDAHRLARRVADYIAGMTDWYALDEHRRLFDATPTLR